MKKPIVRTSLADQIKEALIAQMAAGVLQPGDRLVELKIAQDMDTSQAPVREALHQLEALSLVEMRRNRGSVVRGVSPAELRDIYAVRAELEGLAAEIAAKTTPDEGSQIGPELLSLCDRMDARQGQVDTAVFVDLNDRFHRCIVEASGNAVLIDIWAKLDIRARTSVNVRRNARRLEVAMAEHRDIATAIASGDGALARQRLHQHIMAVVADEMSEASTST